VVGGVSGVKECGFFQPAGGSGAAAVYQCVCVRGRVCVCGEGLVPPGENSLHSLTQGHVSVQPARCSDI